MLELKHELNWNWNILSLRINANFLFLLQYEQAIQDKTVYEQKIAEIKALQVQATNPFYSSPKSAPRVSYEHPSGRTHSTVEDLHEALSKFRRQPSNTPRTYRCDRCYEEFTSEEEHLHHVQKCLDWSASHGNIIVKTCTFKSVCVDSMSSFSFGCKATLYTEHDYHYLRYKCMTIWDMRAWLFEIEFLLCIEFTCYEHMNGFNFSYELFGWTNVI